MPIIKSKRIKHFSLLLFLIYLVVLINLLFFSDYYGRSVDKAYHYNLTLFKEISRFIKYRNAVGLEGWFTNIIGNIVAFVPLGLLVPIILEKCNRWIHIFMISLSLSLVIELTQFVTKVGILDVDDLFLNTLGGMLGYFLFMIIKRVKIRDHIILGGEK